MNDRIKVAKAIGWKWNEVDDHPFVGSWCGGRWTSPSGETFPRVVGCEVPPPFDPENDANDDYAVLEGMRGRKRPDQYSDFKEALWHMHPPMQPWIWRYEIGDFYHAAFKALK